MRLPSVLRDRNAQANFDKLARSAPEGPYTANSGTVLSGGQVNITVAHGLGRTPRVVAGHLEDTGAGWSHQFGWRAQRDSTSVLIVFLNHGPNTAAAILNFYLIG
jgi:hypothetical protein